MKNLMLVMALALPLSTFAASPPKVSSVTDLQEIAWAERAAYEQTDCNLTVEPLKGAVLIRAADASQTVELLVKESDTILLQTEELADGSFIRTFDVPGVGHFRALHADDSYMSVEVRAGERVLQCETDF